MGQYNPILLSMFIILLLFLLKTFMFLVYSSWYVKVDFFLIFYIFQFVLSPNIPTMHVISDSYNIKEVY